MSIFWRSKMSTKKEKVSKTAGLTMAITEVSQKLAITYEATAAECMLSHAVIAVTGLLYLTKGSAQDVKDMINDVVDKLYDEKLKANIEKGHARMK